MLYFFSLSRWATGEVTGLKKFYFFSSVVVFFARGDISFAESRHLGLKNSCLRLNFGCRDVPKPQNTAKKPILIIIYNIGVAQNNIFSTFS